MGKNPYIGMYGLGGYVPYPAMPMPNMIPPDQYKQQMMERLQPQIDQYGALYQQSQAQMQMQVNSGQYVKVNSYEEVKSISVPADGRPIMVFDETAGRLYSKKFENGQTYIRGFQLVPLDDQPEAPKKEEAKPEAKEDSKDPLSTILDKLGSIETRLTAVEGKGNADVGV